MNRGLGKQSSIIFEVPPSLEFHDPEDEKFKCQQFKEELQKFHKDKGNETFKVP